MTTRYTSLVSVKKNIMQKSERVVESANAMLMKAMDALETSYEELSTIKTPQEGRINSFLSARALLDSQRLTIKHNEEWVEFAKSELAKAKETLKLAMTEYEKFKYLEHQEIEKIVKLRKIKEAKDLDEIALITHNRKVRSRVA